jgi:hypothetical protein
VRRFFGQPPPPRFANGSLRSKRDLLCVQARGDALLPRCMAFSGAMLCGHHGARWLTLPPPALGSTSSC